MKLTHQLQQQVMQVIEYIMLKLKVKIEGEK